MRAFKGHSNPEQQGKLGLSHCLQRLSPPSWRVTSQLGKQKPAQALGPCHSWFWMMFRLVASACPSPRSHSHLGSEPAQGRYGTFSAVSPSSVALLFKWKCINLFFLGYIDFGTKKWKSTEFLSAYTVFMSFEGPSFTWILKLFCSKEI